jgi:hypothetical protein
MNREELIATATKISELREKISQMASLQKELKRLEALIDTVTGEPPARSRNEGNSIAERTGRFLESKPDRDWSAEEVAAELGTKVPTTRAAFSKLRSANRIIDTRRGRVRAKRDESTSGQSDSPQEDERMRAA